MQDKMGEAIAQGLISAEQVAGSILEERCWVRWPFLQEALVQAVSDRSHKVTMLSPQLRIRSHVVHQLQCGRACDTCYQCLLGCVSCWACKKNILFLSIRLYNMVWVPL